MARAERKQEEGSSGPRRTCVVTRRARPPEELIRFVLDPEGKVVPDVRRNLPGRGVWVTASADLVARAARSGCFGRGFKTAVQVSPALATEVEALLERDALQSMSLANKAGCVTTGSAKVEAAIARDSLAALVHARDGGADGARKLRQALTRRWGEAAAQLPLVDTFDSAQLDLALGRTNVIHAALKKGPAAAAFLARWTRLAHYRGQTGAQTVEEDSSRTEVVADDADGARDE